MCVIEALRGPAAPYVFFLIELFPGPVEAGSARQNPLILLNDVSSVSVNFGVAAARRGLLWMTSQRDKQSSPLDTGEGTITSTPPRNISAAGEHSKKKTSLYKKCRRQRDCFHFFYHLQCFCLSSALLMTGGTF